MVKNACRLDETKCNDYQHYIIHKCNDYQHCIINKVMITNTISYINKEFLTALKYTILLRKALNIIKNHKNH